LHTLSLGKHNPRLVTLRKAIHKGELTNDGLLPIEGPKLLEEASRSGIEVLDVFIRRGVGGTFIPVNSRIYELDPATFQSIQTTEESQGIIALVRPRVFAFHDLVSGGPPLIVVLGRVQDPGNVGTILRIAESFGATGCVALAGTAGVTNSKVVRASAGSVFRIPHIWHLDLPTLQDELKKAGIPLVGMSPSAKSTVDQWDWRNPVAILIGNEGGGLSREEIGACEGMLRIPHHPSVDSLNSAIATAVILYEASKHHERIII
jgi:RNA methyltransferase, TrmH family